MRRAAIVLSCVLAALAVGVGGPFHGVVAIPSPADALSVEAAPLDWPDGAAAADASSASRAARADADGWRSRIERSAAGAILPLVLLVLTAWAGRAAGPLLASPRTIHLHTGLTSRGPPLHAAV